MLQYGVATHNSYLQVLVELGIIGLIILMYIWNVVYVSFTKVGQTSDGVYFRVIISIAFVTLFISNTIVLVQSPHFMTALMIVVGGVQAYQRLNLNSEDDVTTENEELKVNGITRVRLKKYT